MCTRNGFGNSDKSEAVFIFLLQELSSANDFIHIRYAFVKRTHTQIHLNTVKCYHFGRFDWLLNFLSLFSDEFVPEHQASCIPHTACAQKAKLNSWIFINLCANSLAWCFNVLFSDSLIISKSNDQIRSHNVTVTVLVAQ